MTSTIERCAFCGEIVSFDEPDVVQLHAGVVGSLVHQQCLLEYDDVTDTGENESPRE
jgi:hypothetical protein